VKDELGQAFQESIHELSTVVAEAVTAVEDTVRICYKHSSPFGKGIHADSSKLAETKKRLRETDQIIRSRLQLHIGGSGLLQHMMEESGLPHEIRNMSLLLVSLLQVSSTRTHRRRSP
jgi:hypothetical protein